MTWPWNIDQWGYQVEHLYQLRVIEPPYDSVRAYFNIGGTILPHYAVCYLVEFEACFTNLVCRSHSRLKHAHSISVRVYEDRWGTNILIRVDTQDGHSALFRRLKDLVSGY
jgi:hypothetical protein